MNPKISIIIINWNGGQKFFKCLQLVLNQNFESFEIVVIDNNSQDNSTDFIKKLNEKNLIFIKNDVNKGYTTSMNQGISASKGKYIFLLNNDAYIYDKEFLKKIYSFLETTDNNIIGVMPLVLFDWDRNTINGGPAIWHHKNMWYEPDLGLSRELKAKTGEIFGGLFISPIIKRELWNKIGEFDEKFFSYGEDFDICYRSAVMGYKFIFNSDLEVFHDHRSSSQEKKSPYWSLFLFHRNYLMVVFKNYELKNIFLSFNDYSRFIRSLLIGSIRNINIKELWLFIKVLISLIILMPHILIQRIQINKNRKIKDSQIWNYDFTLTHNPHYNYGSVQISVLSTIGRKNQNE